MNLPTRVSAAPQASAAPEAKGDAPVATSDAPDFKLAPARAAAAPVAAAGVARSGGSGVPSAGKRSGTSGGGSSGNDYFAPEDDDRAYQIDGTSRIRLSRSCVRLLVGMCERVSAGTQAVATGALSRPPATPATTPVFSLVQPRFAAATARIANAAHRPHMLVLRRAGTSRESLLEDQRYASCMAGAVDLAAADLASGAIDNLEQLWHRAQVARRQGFLAQKGVDSADALRSADAVVYQRLAMARYGLWRETRIDRCFVGIRRTIQQQARALFAHPVEGTPHRWSHGDRTLVFTPHPGSPREGLYRLEVGLPGRAAEMHGALVAWTFVTNPATGEATDLRGVDRIECMTLANPMDQGDPGAIRFSQAAVHADAQAALQRAFGADQPAAILRHALEAYWQLVRAAPDLCGNAAKAHFVLQSALLAKGIDLAPVRPGMVPGLEAMARTLDEWLVHAPRVFTG